MNPTLLPLALLEANDEEPVEGITRFQKLVFLFDREIHEEEDIYQFRPDKYGPFSKRLYDDLDWLVEKGLVERDTTKSPFGNDTQRYKLTERGKRALQRAREKGQLEFDEQPLSELKDEYNDQNLWNLLETVYEKYPEMAKNSKLNI